MKTSFNTKHYTYHTGSALKLNSCCSIIYYYSKNFPEIELLTITSLSEKYETYLKNLESGKRVGKSTRSGVGEYFTLNPTSSESGEIKFDIVMYLSDYDVPLGYTFFSEPQVNMDSGSVIKVMKFNFMFSVVSEIVDFDIVYSLDSIWSNPEPLLTEKFPVSATEIISKYVSSPDSPRLDYLRYTDDILQLESSDTYCIVTDTSVLLKGDSYKFWLPSEMEFGGLRRFTKYSVGIHQGDLVLYRWNDDGYYSVNSLTKFNHYGILKLIKSGKVDLGESESIYTLVDNIVVLNAVSPVLGVPKKKCGYIEMDTGHKYIGYDKRIINDSWDSASKVSIINNNCTASDLDLKQLSCPPGKYYYLLDKFGVWYVFYNENTRTVCWSSLYGSAYFKDTDKVLPFNDRVLFRVTSSSMDLYTFDGPTEYGFDSSPSQSVSLVYKDNREFYDSIRRRPVFGNNLGVMTNKTHSFRGLIFYVYGDKIKYF